MSVKTSSRTFLKKFKFGNNSGFTLEFGNCYIRLFANHGQVLKTATEEAFEIQSPYTLDDLWDGQSQYCKIQTMQIGDIIYIFHHKYQKRLLRYSNTNWVLEDWECLNGPFDNVNTDDELTLSASGADGNIRITASSSLFSSTDVGRLLRLNILNDDTKPWVVEETIVVGDVRVSDRNYYQAINAGVAGNVKPVHTAGSKSDGAVVWKYLHSGYGVAKITNVNSSTQVIAAVKISMPPSITTSSFEFGLIRPGVNCPIAGTIYKNRLAIMVDSGQTDVCISCSGDFTNFADKEFGEILAESAIKVPVLSKEYTKGAWLVSGDVLFVGTSNGEFYIDGASNGQALAADNVALKQISSIGSKPITPIVISGHCLFIDRFGASIRDLVYSLERDGYDQLDASILGKNMLSSGIVDWDYQDVPNKLIWLICGDGSMITFTFDAMQQVSALAMHNLSGKVESVAVIPSPSQRRDDVWCVVRRVVDGVSKRYVEWIDAGMVEEYTDEIYYIDNIDDRDVAQAKHVRDNAFYVDSGLIYDRLNGDATTTLTGLSHLKGCEVAIMANGMECVRQIVDENGAISIRQTDTHVVVGLPMQAIYSPNAFYIQTAKSQGMSVVQRIDHLTLMLYRSLGGKVGPKYADMTDILYYSGNKLGGVDVDLYTGNVIIPWNGGSSSPEENGANIIIFNDGVYPFNILAIAPSVSAVE